VNVRHLSQTDKWHTPLDIVERARRILGTIDLDPASDPAANRRVKATHIITQEEDGLKAPWPPGSVFLNPPGGKLGNKSLAALFWQRLIQEWSEGHVSHAIFVAFSLEQLQTTQNLRPPVPSIGEFMFVVPARRLRFDRPDGRPGPAPSHSSAIVYVPGSIDATAQFIREFKDLGCIVNRS
jgi:hypothetical protein